MEKSILEEEINRRLAEAGYPVRMKSKLCQDWRDKHNELCIGCPSEKACNKKIAIGMVLMLASSIDNLSELLAAAPVLKMTIDRIINDKGEMS